MTHRDDYLKRHVPLATPQQHDSRTELRTPEEALRRKTRSQRAGQPAALRSRSTRRIDRTPEPHAAGRRKSGGGHPVASLQTHLRTTQRRGSYSVWPLGGAAPQEEPGCWAGKAAAVPIAPGLDLPRPAVRPYTTRSQAWSAQASGLKLPTTVQRRRQASDLKHRRIHPSAREFKRSLSGIKTGDIRQYRRLRISNICKLTDAWIRRRSSPRLRPEGQWLPPEPPPRSNSASVAVSHSAAARPRWKCRIIQAYTGWHLLKFCAR